ncbi:hypothetical protein GGI12_005689 [Dipsacomyces acuminosporus]|nr:hypothetical protein GGI12_005689 [Dipsacomyces acuminosporus]
MGSGTSCYLFNSVAACDWEGAHPGNDCVTSGINNKQKGQSVSLLAASGSSARPFPVYTTQGVSSRIEFMPITVSSGKYTALIKMQTLLQPYSQSWMLELQLPPGQTIDHTSRGSIVGNGTSVTIKSDKSKEKLKRMAIVLEVSGTYTGKYSVPDQSTARVTAY